MENYENIEFKPLEAFEEFLCIFKGKNLKMGVTPDSINLKDYRIIESTGNLIVELELSPIARMKAVKTESELDHMRFCFRKTDIVVNRAIQWVNQNLEKDKKISEKDFYEKVKELFKEEGATSLSFEVIASSGKNTAIIHYTCPDENTYINPGDLILLDCGAYFEGGLATDITRTFLAGGSKAVASDKAKKVYTTVLKAFLNGLNFPVKEDSSGFDIDAKVRSVISENPEEGFSFPHGAGHGVGIPVHEAPPRLGSSELSKTVLKQGMCFTIEPGIYCDCWGGVRLENTVTLGKENDILKIISLVRSKFDENLVDLSMLTNQEKSWFIEYQKKATG